MKRLLSISLLMMVICSACNRLHENEITHLAFKAEEDSRWGLIDWEGNPLIENEFTEINVVRCRREIIVCIYGLFKKGTKII